MAYNDPAALTWTPDQRAYVTEHDGARWALIAHAVHRGKSGWSGTDEWCLHRIDPPDPVTAYGAWPIDDGRWLAHPGRRGLARAKEIAAWIIANPGAADGMTHHQITDAMEARG